MVWVVESACTVYIACAIYRDVSMTQPCPPGWWEKAKISRFGIPWEARQAATLSARESSGPTATLVLVDQPRGMAPVDWGRFFQRLLAVSAINFNWDDYILRESTKWLIIYMCKISYLAKRRALCSALLCSYSVYRIKKKNNNIRVRNGMFLRTT